jgi:hypothetical protein
MKFDTRCHRLENTTPCILLLYSFRIFDLRTLTRICFSCDLSRRLYEQFQPNRLFYKFRKTITPFLAINIFAYGIADVDFFIEPFCGNLQIISRRCSALMRKAPNCATMVSPHYITLFAATPITVRNGWAQHEWLRFLAT